MQQESSPVNQRNQEIQATWDLNWQQVSHRTERYSYLLSPLQILGQNDSILSQNVSQQPIIKTEENQILLSSNSLKNHQATKKIISLINDQCLIEDDFRPKKKDKKKISCIQILVSKLYSRNNDDEKGNRFQNNIFIVILKKIPEKKKKFKKFTSKYVFQIRRHLLFQPDGIFKIFWDIICMILIFYEMIMIPIRISFADENFYQFEQLDLALDFFFLFDILITFNTAIYRKGILLLNRKIIVMKYLKLWFWLDLLSSFPYNLIITEIIKQQESNQRDYIQNSAKALKIIRFTRFIKVIRLLRVMKLKFIIAKIITYLDISDGIKTILGFLRLAFIVLFLAHWIACSWHAIGELNQGNNWLITQDVQQLDMSEQYITSIYWAITTMLTIGYGDITPQNQSEKIFALSTILIGCAVFSYSMNSMGQILINGSPRDQIFDNQMNKIGTYLKLKKINVDLQIKIKKYFEYAQVQKKKMENNDRFVFSKLSHQIRSDIIFEINGKIILKSLFFVEHFSQDLIYQTAIIIKEVIYAPEEIIFQEEDQQINNLYYLNSGIVDITLRNNTIISKIEDGTFFGEIGFFADFRTASAITSDFCTLFYIERPLFISILSKYQGDLEIFCELRDQLKLYKNFSKLKFNCYLCNEIGHIVINCPLLNFLLDKKSQFEEAASLLNKLKIVYPRKNKKKQNTLSNLKQINKDTINWRNKQQNLQKSNQDIFIKIRRVVQNMKLQKRNNKRASFCDLSIKLLYANNQNIKQMLRRNPLELQIAKEKLEFNQYLTRLDEFDKIKEFKNYFPHNNITQINRCKRLSLKQRRSKLMRISIFQT